MINMQAEAAIAEKNNQYEDKSRKRIFWMDLKGTPREIDEIKAILKQGRISKCKYCGSSKIVKYGYYHNIQRWLCRECGCKFADNGASFGMKIQTDQVATILTMYYEGAGIKEIQSYLAEVYHSYLSESTIYEWIKRITEGAAAYCEKCQPKVSNTWIATETTLLIGNQKAFLFDIVDTETSFVLASQLSINRTAEEMKKLLVKAINRARKAPEMVITNQMVELIDGTELDFGTETKYIKATQPRNNSEVRLIEHFYSMVKIRTKILQRYKKVEGANSIYRGWRIHYNYMRPYELLNNSTPAIKAGMEYPLKVKLR
jgi:transposase-like protein